MRNLSPIPRRSGLRRLSEEEIALWAEVAQTVARRQGAVLTTPVPPVAPPAASAATVPSARAVPAKPPAKAPGPPPLAPLERKLKRDLSRGRGAIDGALDLHGLTQAEAHYALRGFLMRAQAQGARLVIVVTGKGRVSSSLWFEEPGVLRRLVPHWLRETDMRAIVMGFEEAARAHGGSGALYVRLRRRGRD